MIKAETETSYRFDVCLCPCSKQVITRRIEGTPRVRSPANLYTQGSSRISMISGDSFAISIFCRERLFCLEIEKIRKTPILPRNINRERQESGKTMYPDYARMGITTCLAHKL